MCGKTSRGYHFADAMKKLAPAIIVAGSMLITSPVNANCGSSFCTINTNWDAQGVWDAPGLKLDLRGEYVTQDTLRSHTGTAKRSEVEDQDHEEIRTINRNLLATFDYSWSRQWGVAVQVPFVNRFHEHLHNHEDEPPELEQWRFKRLGDVRVTGRYQFTGDVDSAVGALFGLKLPTGSFNVKNSERELAERTLQPGTGTTDLLLGAYVNGRPIASALTWFGQVFVQAPLNERDEFRPGEQLSLDAGLGYAFNPSVSALLQVNLSLRGRDEGDEAETEESGSTQAFVSPGFSVEIFRDGRLYGFYQIPIYQRVNGVQLTADRAFVLGLRKAF